MLFIETKDDNFNDVFEGLLKRGSMDMSQVTPIVLGIIDEIKSGSDEALLAQIERFDKWSPKGFEDIVVTPKQMSEAYENLDEDLKKSLHVAYERIFTYHQKQLPKSWLSYEDSGVILGQKATPVDRAGLYIPGGKAAYPSSLLMNAIPARVAGVESIVVCTPAPNGEINETLLGAMHICGISKAYKVGGASAVGAMAYGTKNIQKVDVITGPGNIFVATAKKMVYGEVNIDMIAGPSEIGVLADESANPKYLAIDLLSQAEHDEMASSILITTCKECGLKVRDEIYEFLKSLSRSKIATESIERRGAIIVASSMEEAVKLMNTIAPEHLEVVTKDPFGLLSKIKHAGAIFLGHYTPEAMGDYIAGPNHTLPTGGTARFYSPLGVENFMKKSSIISFSQEGFKEIAKDCARLAHSEGLTAHENSVLERLKAF